MKKKMVKTGIGIGAAAAMSIGLTGCPKQADTPPVQEPDQVQVTDDTADEPVDTADTPADDTAPDDDSTADDDSAALDEPPNLPPPNDPGTPDCLGTDQFTEKCGYKSPTKYAVLDPSSIVNA